MVKFCSVLPVVHNRDGDVEALVGMVNDDSR